MKHVLLCSKDPKTLNKYSSLANSVGKLAEHLIHHMSHHSPLHNTWWKADLYSLALFTPCAYTQCTRNGVGPTPSHNKRDYFILRPPSLSLFSHTVRMHWTEPEENLPHFHSWNERLPYPLTRLNSFEQWHMWMGEQERMEKKTQKERKINNKKCIYFQAK